MMKTRTTDHAGMTIEPMVIVGIVEIANDKNGNKMCDCHELYLSLAKNVSHEILILDTDMYMIFKPFTSYVSIYFKL